jgi:N-acetylglucosaminyldiphosphoundecaprenol N-acetyl-beta-D-mannosaminyltransferase
MMNILGVKIHNYTKKQLNRKIAKFLGSNRQNTIFTPNPEMLVDAKKDKEFRDILNSSSMNICDGKGIQLVSKHKIHRLPGVDFVLDICKIAEEKNKSIYLLGTGDIEILANTKKELKNKYPNLKIVGESVGPSIELKDYKIKLDENENEKIIDDIIDLAPDVLFVAFGHVKQEKWIDKYLEKMPSVKIAMGVGGSLDFISGKVKRAPKSIQKIGLEWLWRLILQPWRVKRIWKATMKFLYLNLKK